MEDQLIDLFYFLVIGSPIRDDMTSIEKLTDAWDKIFRILFNVDRATNSNELDCESDSANISSYDSTTELSDETTTEDTTNYQIKTNLNTDVSVDKFNKLKSDFDYMFNLYEEFLIKFFNDRKYLLNVTEENRDMRRMLYEKGSLDVLELLYPNNQDISSVTTINIKSLSGDGESAIVRLDTTSIDILQSGRGYRMLDILIGIKDDKIFIFKPKRLRNIIYNNTTLTPINLNMPIHTQIYRFFNPNSFDVNQIKVIQNFIEEHGIEHVIKNLTKNLF